MKFKNKQYRQENKDKNKEYRKRYYDDNKSTLLEKLKQKNICEC